MKTKKLYLDWGCYKVTVVYDPDDVNTFDVFYNKGSGTTNTGLDYLEGKPYRRLTKPEMRAALEAIYRNEQIKIQPIDEEPRNMALKTNTELRNCENWNFGARHDDQTRNIFAARALEFSLERYPKRTAEEHAAFAFKIADAMMTAKDKVHVEVCKNCHQEVNRG